MLKETSADVKKHVVFSIGFSSNFHEKSMETRKKRVKTGLVHTNR